MQTIITDFGSSAAVSKTMKASAERANKLRPVMEEIAVDMVRVTELLWLSQGRRGGGAWAPLSPEVVKRKGTNRILYTAGANPGYTPHADQDVLAGSVTRVGGAHQVLAITRTSIEFGSDLPYAGAQYSQRPFIRFMPNDTARWAGMIGAYITEPFQVTKIPAFGGGFMIRGAGGRFVGAI